MKKKIFSFLFAFCLSLTAVLCPVGLTATKANADMGPKPSIVVTFGNMGDELCYGTLLSSTPSTGPHSVWSEEYGDEENSLKPDSVDDESWRALIDYKDADGYYFLQTIWLCSQSKTISWTYYPPSTFKILLYYPESGRFLTSGIYETYAFHSYFTVDMSKADLTAETAALSARNDYPYGQEILYFLCRVAVTVAAEILVALLFVLRKKKQLLTIFAVNAATQVLLNAALSVVAYFYSVAALFFTVYILAEIGIVVLEAVLYRVFIKDASTGKIILYAAVANILSFLAGWGLSVFLPFV